LFSPFLNQFVSRMDKVLFKKFLAVLFCFFAPYAMFVNVIRDPFFLNAGYSFLWLSIMWVVGAGIKRFHMLVKSRYCGIIFIFLVGISVLSSVVIRFTTSRLFGREIATDLLLSYLSPVVVGLGVIYLSVFYNIEIKESERLRKSIVFLSKGAFGIYLFHVHPIIMQEIIHDRYLLVTTEAGVAVFGYVIRDAIALFVIALLVDLLRIYMFRLMHINDIASLSERWILHIRNKFFSFLKMRLQKD